MNVVLRLAKNSSSVVTISYEIVTNDEVRYSPDYELEKDDLYGANFYCNFSQTGTQINIVVNLDNNLQEETIYNFYEEEDWLKFILGAQADYFMDEDAFIDESKPIHPSQDSMPMPKKMGLMDHYKATYSTKVDEKSTYEEWNVNTVETEWTCTVGKTLRYSNSSEFFRLVPQVLGKR